jgi:DNA-binding NarL/FixJ family response regulator
MTNAAINVVVCDDSLLVRQGIVAMLHDADMNVIGEHSDAINVVAKAAGADLVILDIRMPPTHTNEGVLAALELRSTFPALPVVLLSQHIETRQLVELISVDASGLGYLLKDRVADPIEFIATLQRVARGGTAIDPMVVSRLVRRERRASPIDALTDREQDVLALMAEGKSNQSIAEALFVGLKTVETHIRSILSKLSIEMDEGDDRRVRAVLLYLANHPTV